MRTCPITAFECTAPHLKCGACPELHVAREEAKTSLERRDRFNELIEKFPDPCPYLAFKDSTGRPAIEIGIKGTF